MTEASVAQPHIHFETRKDRPRVFRYTRALIDAAAARNSANMATSLGEDLADTGWLRTATGLVTSNDILCDPRFPLRTLTTAAPHLRWIHVSGAGIEPLLPLDWLPGQVVLTNNSGVHVEKIRESAAMMLLMVHARVPVIMSNQRHSVWQQIFTPSIAGRTVLIVGVGDMGGAAAEAARDLRLRVLGVRRDGGSHPCVERMYRPSEIDQALPLADFLVLAAPLTHETKGLLNRRRCALLKRGAGLINIGRAGLIDDDAMIEALRDGTISSAVLDVYDPEPLPAQSQLWNAPNLLLMPHVTSDDEDLYLPKTFDLVFENAGRLLSGIPLLNIVDRQREY
jgi:phosphoglycerate dehydrogenase-like enzyme